MLNPSIGDVTNLDGRPIILTRAGAVGHALYGPYRDVDPGTYCVTFDIHLLQQRGEGDYICALADVVADGGQREVAFVAVTTASIRSSSTVQVHFRISERSNLEFRVRVNGQSSLLIADEPELRTRDGSYTPPSPMRLTPAIRTSVPLTECFEAGIRMAFHDDEITFAPEDLLRAADILARFDPDASETIGKAIAERLRERPVSELYDGLCGGSESLRGAPSEIGLTSSLCRQIHFTLDEFRFWMGAMQREPRMHRKDWEWFYIAQVLFERGMLAPGKKGLVFAVGLEPLPALFARYGCSITATDQAPEQAARSGWIESHQYSSQVESLFDDRICAREQFFNGVSYASVDMNDIPATLNGLHDFCWSSCAFEHLGSIEHGLRFVERSLDTLVPGGIAVHTTEFNLTSNDDTVESETLSIFRKRDIEELITRLERAGHMVEPLDLTMGHGFAETVIDLPPHKQSPHLRLRMGDYDCTSIGLIVQKTPA